MAEFTEVEEQLLECVTDDRLRVSLAAIRQAAEDIWAADAPRIIQDYTDHGIKHSERLAGFAAKLLEANDGRDLSVQEMYLLLAGIYLHDIGMQCDVVKFPEIKARAEALGAQFDVEFTARTASGYSVDEQKAIRKNHQSLTAGWIDHAYRTGKTVLGPATRSIPEDQVADLMDVCRYHAKLPISDCPLTFKFDPTQRKQLVAALLRFADELDVDGHRVSIETVKNFRLDLRNSVYWWLHNRTKVIFSARNVIILTIRLYPDDVEQHGSFVHAAFIAEFQTKNRPVLGVLRQNSIPMAISAESEVAEDDHAEPLPSEIVQMLQAMQQKRDPPTELADEVRTWLQAIRYEVSESQQLDDRTVEMLATLDLGTVKQRVLVRCIGGEITPPDVDALDQVLDRKTPQGWLISDKRVSERARARAAEDDAFQVFTLTDFLRQMVWGPYFDVLTSLVEKDRIPDLYVDLGCYKQEMGEEEHEIGRDRYPSLDAYIDDWLTERGKMHISLLGEFGTGKTWFCRHYAYRQLECYLEDPANERLPLLITLRAFTKALTAQQLINDALLEQYKLPFVGSAFQVFQEMNRRGKLLLILDGFDEMARQVDYQTVVDNFRELAELVDEGSKIILTSRTEYFRWARESEKILGGEEFGRRTIVLSPPRFEVLYLEAFSDDQIREVIIRRLGAEDGPVVANRILGAPNLAEMARKPVLIELLLAALDEVSADVLENPAQVYLYATNRLLLRNIDTKRTFMTTADKLYFLCELAWEMIRSGELRIHYTDIPERIKAYFGDRIKDQHELDTWDYDLRAQTLLHRDAAGYYEFAHKSLAEYFVAFKFAAELGCLAPASVQTYCGADGQPCKVPIEHKDILGLVKTFGAMALTDERMRAVRDLLLGLIAEDATKWFWEIIDETKGKIPEQVKYAGGNAATLLRMMGESFKGANLARTVLSGADLFNTDLTGTDLQGVCLRGADLQGCTLENVDLRGADLLNVHIRELRWVNSVAWSPDGQWLAQEGDDGNVLIWDTNEWEHESLSKKLFGPIYGNICWGKSGTLLAIANQDVTHVWDMQEREPKTRLTGCSENTVFMLGDNLLVTTKTGKIIGFETRHYSQVLSLPLGDWRVRDIDIDESGRLLLLGGFEPVRKRGIHVGSIAHAEVWDILKKQRVGVFRLLQDDSQIYAVCFASPDNLIIVGDTERRFLVLDEKLADIQFVIDDQMLERASGVNCFAQSLSFCARLNQCSFSSIYRKIYVLDTKSLSILTGLDLPGYSRAVIDYDPLGRFLASGSTDGTVRIWDVDPASHTFGQCLRVLETKMNCRGMQISSARGLEQVIPWLEEEQEARIYTLLELFADRGAVLDEEQKRTVAEARKRRKAGDQRK